MTGRHTIDQITSDQLDHLYDQLDHIRTLHQPTGVVAATESGNPPDCTTCGPNRWPCPTYQAITETPPAATQATDDQTKEQQP